MKKIFGILGIGALLSLASCSEDAPLGPGSITSDMVNSYINVRIAAPGVDGTRADGDGDGQYEYGKEEENAVKSYLLLFYDNAGNLVGVSEKGLDKETTNQSGQNIAVIRSGTAEVILVEGSQMPTQLLAVINATGDMVESLKNSNLSEATKLVVGKDGVEENLSSIWTSGDKVGFLMNNSVYYEDGKTLVWTVPIEGMLYSDEATAKSDLAKALVENDPEAKKKLVDVYVERLAVKGGIESLGQVTATPIVVTDFEGKEYELVFNATCFDVTATPDATYFKKDLREINNYSDGLFKTWMNAYNDFRSYWVRSIYATSQYDGASYPIVGINPDLAPAYLLKYKSTTEVEQAKNQLGSTVYFPEHTFAGSRLSANETTEQNPYVVATSFLLNGQYIINVKGGEKASKYANTNFYLNGYYDISESKTKYQIFNDDELINVFATVLKNGKVVATDAEGNLDEKVLEKVHKSTFFDAAGQKQENNPANRITLQVKDGSKVYTLDDEGTWKEYAGQLSDLNDKVEKAIGTLMMYNSGRAFFYIPIKHYTGNMTDEEKTANFPTLTGIKTGNFGVVRNHVYRMIIDNITGLGIGVGPDPNVPELPDPKPVQNYYINARLNVLQWHIMGQHVSL